MKLITYLLLALSLASLLFSGSGRILDKSGRYYFVSYNISDQVREGDFVYVIQNESITDSLQIIYIGNNSSLAESPGPDKGYMPGQMLWLDKGEKEPSIKIDLVVKDVQDQIIYFESDDRIKVGDIMVATIKPEIILHPVLQKEIALGDYQEVFIKITNKNPATMLGLASTGINTLEKGHIIEAQVYLDY